MASGQVAREIKMVRPAIGSHGICLMIELCMGSVSMTSPISSAISPIIKPSFWIL